MRILIAMALLLVASQASAADPLKGSRAALAKQNQMADKANLSRITEAQLPRFKERHLLVSLPIGRGITVDPRLASKWRWCRPWTQEFLLRLGENFERQFPGHALQVNSAVRTVEYQGRLLRRNGNAATNKPGPRASSHPTGATVDIAKRGLTPPQIRWLRGRLTNLEQQNALEATEEFVQPVFHVMVYKS